MAPDVPTLYLVTMLVSGFSAVLLFLMSRRLGGRALPVWTLANLALCLGYSLFIAQPGGSAVHAFVLGNTALVLAVGLMKAGTDAFVGRPVRVAEIVVGPLVALIGLTLSVRHDGGLGQQLLIISAAGLFYLACTARELWRWCSPRTRFIRIICVLAITLFAGSYILRAAVLATGLVDPADTVADGITGVVRVLALSMIGAWNCCVLYLVLDRQASIDDLTGLPNRGALVEAARQMVAEANATNRPLTVVMMDIDGFKSINDRFGHAIGDRVLVAFAGVVAGCLRRSDVVGRVGGEEFCVILADCASPEALLVAERIRERCERDLASVAGHAVQVTLSLGFATRTVGAPSLPGLMHNADVALYAAKASGRNRVVWAGDIPAAVEDRRAITLP